MMSDSMPHTVRRCRSGLRHRQPPTNKPDAADVSPAGNWNTATWDVDGWAIDAVPRQNWQGVTGLGRVGAPRIRAALQGLRPSRSRAADMIYEEGGLM